MPGRGRRPGRARGSTRQRDDRGAAQERERIENNPADNGLAAQERERAENNGAEDGLAQNPGFFSTLLPGRVWKMSFFLIIIWLSITGMERFTDIRLFTNYQNIGMWTNRIRQEILCGVVLGVYKACGTGAFGDFVKWGGCCFLVLRFGELAVQNFAVTRDGT